MSIVIDLDVVACGTVRGDGMYNIALQSSTGKVWCRGDGTEIPGAGTRPSALVSSSEPAVGIVKAQKTCEALSRLSKQSFDVHLFGFEQLRKCAIINVLVLVFSSVLMARISTIIGLGALGSCPMAHEG